MKHSLSIIRGIAASLALFAASTSSLAQRTYVTDKSYDATTLLACPEGTILSGAYDTSGSSVQISRQASDQELEEPYYTLKEPCKVYRSFSGCMHPIEGVRVVGCFAYFDAQETYSYIPSTSRGGVDENGDMTEPINFEVAFYKMDSDGYPADEVYKEVVPITGVNTGVDGTLGVYYFFTANLSTPVNLDEGFFSFSACDNGGPFPTSWFMLLGNASTGGYTISQNINTSQYSSPYTTAPITFCFTGDESKTFAERAIKLNGIVNPTFNEVSEFATTTVELVNIGSTTVSDATLELYLDSHLITTETINRDLEPGEVFSYTFGARVNCDDAPHVVTVKNVTPGDEHVVSDEVSAEILGSQTSYSLSPDPLYITNFKVGDQIDNTSGATTYSDFTDQAATIKPGETLKATLTCAGSEYTHYMKLWIDWNGNGKLDDKGEFMGYSTDGTFDIAIPQDDVCVTPGDKLMRVILSYEDTQPTALYSVGETEDYTLLVLPGESGPVISTDKPYISATTTDKNSATEDLTISNKGDSELTANLSVAYSLPHAPLRLLSEKENFTLSYCGAYDRYVKLTDRNNPLIFANFFPGEMMKSLKGMSIEGIDVYMGTTGSGSLVVYGQKTQSEPGELLASQSVTFNADEWNHLSFDSPVELTGEDLWIGLEVPAGSYMIGLDYGPALKGYSDLIKSDKQYYLTDLGYNTNLCMSTRLTGTSPATSWLTLDKESVSVPAGGSQEINATISPAGLDSLTTYEAAIVASSNDPVSAYVEVPVYLWPTGKTTRIVNVTQPDKATVRVLQPKTIIVEAGEHTVSHITAFRANGSVAGFAFGNKLNLASATTGVYVVNIVYSDGTEESAAVIIKR